MYITDDVRMEEDELERRFQQVGSAENYDDPAIFEMMGNDIDALEEPGIVLPFPNDDGNRSKSHHG